VLKRERSSQQELATEQHRINSAIMTHFDFQQQHQQVMKMLLMSTAA